MCTGSFPGVKRPGRGVDYPPPSSAVVEGRVELYTCSPSGPSWPAQGRTLSCFLVPVCISSLHFRACMSVSPRCCALLYPQFSSYPIRQVDGAKFISIVWSPVFYGTECSFIYIYIKLKCIYIYILYTFVFGNKLYDNRNRRESIQMHLFPIYCTISYTKVNRTCFGHNIRPSSGSV